MWYLPLPFSALNIFVSSVMIMDNLAEPSQRQAEFASSFLISSKTSVIHKGIITKSESECNGP